MTENVQVSVEKEAYDLAQGFVKFSQALKQALADGWQPGQDLPLLLTAVLADLVPVFQNVSALGADLKENEKAFVTAFLLSSTDLLYVFKKQGV